MPETNATAGAAWARRPLVLLAPPFVLGCHASAAREWPAAEAALAAASALLALGLLLGRRRGALGVALAGVVAAGLAAGWLRGAPSGAARSSPSLRSLAETGALAPRWGRAVPVVGRPRDLVRVRGGPGGPTCEVELELASVRLGRVTLRDPGTVRLSAPAEALDALRAAETVRAFVRLRRPTSWQGPGFPRSPALRDVAGTRPLALARATSARLLEIERRSRPTLRGLRETLAASLERAFGDERDGLALARALVLGEQDFLDDELVRGLRATGAAHVLSVSGLHVALVAGAVGWLLAACGASVRASTLAALLAAWGFAAVAGLDVPVVRCASLLTVLAAGRVLLRATDSWNALAAAALVSAGLAPHDALSLGFVLTFGATAGLIALTRPLSRALPSGRSVPALQLRDAVAASLAAWLALLPVSAAAFQQVSWLGVGANLVAVPVSGLATGAALAAAALAPLSTLAARAPALLVTWCERALGAAGEPWAAGTVAVPSPPPWPLVLWPAALGLSLATSRPRVVAAAVLVALVAGRELVAAGEPAWPPGREARVTVLDVGQGSATLVEIGTERGAWRILVDGGGLPGSRFDVGERVVARNLRALGITSLDAVVASQPDFDHAGGLPSIVRAFSPGEVVRPPGSASAYGRLDRAADAVGARRRLAAAGDELAPRDAWASLAVLWPPRDAASRGRLSDNDASLVLELAPPRGRALALLPGDVEGRGEAGLVEAGLAPVRVLVAPHHGSRTSSGSALLAAAAPSLAVISCGRDSRFGHPHAEALARLGRAGLRPWITSREGAVTATFAGRSTRMTCWASARAEERLEPRVTRPARARE